MNPHFRDLLSALTAEGAEFLGELRGDVAQAIGNYSLVPARIDIPKAGQRFLRFDVFHGGRPALARIIQTISFLDELVNAHVLLVRSTLAVN